MIRLSLDTGQNDETVSRKYFVGHNLIILIVYVFKYEVCEMDECGVSMEASRQVREAKKVSVLGFPQSVSTSLPKNYASI